ncbi:hypothetical protein [Stigmatella hybrida]|uniref:hypothetical protein n=1 Tax=Stigmatella hybrida TaxID=394097 RepID=UPI001CDA9238|nr:hypothetical protein [Stigmatella hybrida]
MNFRGARAGGMALGWGLLAQGTGGCGEYGLADETYRVDPVAVLDGQLRAPLDAGRGPTAMALAWAPGLSSLEELSVALLAGNSACGLEQGALLQPVPHEEHFPVNFVLPLSTVPPPAAQHVLASQGGQGRLALGWVLSFQDANRNGRLDLAPEEGSPERVMATSLDSGMAVLFMDGELPREREGIWRQWPGRLPLGFSLLQGGLSPEGGASLRSLPADSTSLTLEGARQVCP